MTYIERSREKLNKMTGHPLILAVETSCDETAAAVVRGRDVISNIVDSQIELHKKYGGVVPEIASREHIKRLQPCVAESLEKAGVTFSDIEAVAVAYGPGLVGALLTGVSCAKALAFALDVPLIGINHIEAHICANYISNLDLEPPFLCLIASGGHTQLVNVCADGGYELVGQTRDDAAGEAFDKIARVLGLPYPGGPNLEKLAAGGKADKYSFPRGLKGDAGFDFTFSGLKTNVINTLHKMEQRGESYEKTDVAASFQEAVVDGIASTVKRALKHTGAGKLAMAGGVAANTALRKRLEQTAILNGAKFYCPEFKYCTDNAAMIGCAAAMRVKRLGKAAASGLDLNAQPSLKLF
ncbi:MAG: tRNA (adenosine(37)-N6)-threonylcarbamoyltransferase complex transferase subunit TsaD [Christensenellales bacterium]|jgi:N6-L-threonylcarbamoyladenine synthase